MAPLVRRIESFGLVKHFLRGGKETLNGCMHDLTRAMSLLLSSHAIFSAMEAAGSSERPGSALMLYEGLASITISSIHSKNISPPFL